MKKVTAMLLAFSICLTMFSACSTNSQADSTTSPESEISTTEAELTEESTAALTEESKTNLSESASETTAAVAENITIIDQADRTITLEQPTEKIVSSYYISTAMLIALGLEDKVVGIEMKADTRELYKLAAPQFLELPAVGSGKEINIEETAALEPDLVIIPKRLSDSVAAFEELNIPVIVVNPESLEDFLYCVRILGEATGTTEIADDFCSYYEETIEYCKSLTENAEKPTVYIGAGSSYLSTCTSEMYQSKLIEYAGGTCASSELSGNYWADISAEQLLIWNPDYFMRVSYSEYSADDILADESLAGLSAVQNQQIMTIPSTIEAWDYPAPSSVLGVIWLTHTLHPELLSKDEYIAEAEDFYKTYFDYRGDFPLLHTDSAKSISAYRQ